MTRKNALFNCKNPYQGQYPKILCVCSAGLLRSPTLAYVLSNKGCNTRAAGVHDYALVPVDNVLAEWADQIICVEPYIRNTLLAALPEYENKCIALNIPDNFEYRAPELIQIIEEQLATIGY